ncbi:MAG: dipicolinate synthase subunit DpsA [Clostridia bacterium]|nr:dipicolinate synthase subunit DpsA [Clostridia bacterium]MBQ6937974.1 dipicolinate synthase subunit DpsA [Clostridia bacterium]MBR2884513.1 dipicolinate synthase subunit DpsA [Clostridia bacterium]
MNIKRLIIIGGDSRIDYLLKALCDEGYDAVRFDGSEPLKKALDKSDAVILGLPCSRDDKSVDAPDLSEEVLIKDLFKMMGSGKLLLAGKMSQAVKAVADVFSVRWVDYFQRDEFEILNAIPTAEGAIQIAMEELPITIHGANIVVTGFGKVAKPLCLLLKNMGANVTVCARKSSARAEARSLGLAATDFSYFNDCIEGADVVYNTVPAVIIRRENLLSAKNTLIIDLASKPGGVDMEAALDLGVKVIWALGLPGKVAPVTAGNIIKETVCNIFSELGE